MVLLALACAAVLIATAALAVVIADAARARLIVYGVCLIASLALFSIALLALLGISDRPSAVTLPLGLPWLGAHFRLLRCRPFSLPWSISARPRPACSRSDTAGTRMPRAGCCRSIRRFSPA